MLRKEKQTSLSEKAGIEVLSNEELLNVRGGESQKARKNIFLTDNRTD